MRTEFKTENQHEQGLTALRRYISEYEEMEIERKQQEEKLPMSKTSNRYCCQTTQGCNLHQYPGRQVRKYQPTDVGPPGL